MHHQPLDMATLAVFRRLSVDPPESAEPLQADIDAHLSVVHTASAKDPFVDIDTGTRPNAVNGVGVPWFVQVKRKRGNVGYNDVRDLQVAIRHESDKANFRNAWGLFVTTGGYTRDVREHQDEFPEITLLDGQELARLVHETGLAGSIPGKPS